MGRKKKGGQQQEDGGGDQSKPSTAPKPGQGGDGPSGKQQQQQQQEQKQKKGGPSGDGPEQHQSGPSGQPQQQQQQRGRPQQHQQQRDQPQQQQQRGGHQQQQRDKPQQQQRDQPQQRGGHQQQQRDKPQQQQRDQPQYQQQRDQSQQQQQRGRHQQQRDKPQQQQRRDQPQQQQQRDQPQQQQQRGGHQQQRDKPQQQQQRDQPQQQERGGSQQPQGAWSQQQQRGGSQQPQGAWSQQQQRGGSQQQQRGGSQQPQGAWSQQQQRGGSQQQQGAWSQQQPQQQQISTPQQQQGAWSQPQPQPQQRGGPQHRDQSQQQKRDHPQQQQEQKKKWVQSSASSPIQSPSISSSSKSSSIQSLASQVSGLSIKSHVSLDRGTRGQKCVIETNYLKLFIEKLINSAYQYDIKFEPDKPKRLLRQAFEEFRTQHLRVEGRAVPLAFDGKSIVYSPILLPSGLSNLTAEVKVTEPDRAQDKTFKVTIKETLDPKIELDSLKSYQQSRIFDKPMRAIQCLDVVLRSPCYSRSTQAGRSFYNPPRQRLDLRDGFELWYGLFQAAVLGDVPLLNIDVSHKSFPSGRNLTEVIRDMRNASLDHELDRRDSNELRSYLKNLEILYKPPDNSGMAKRYKFNDLKDSAERQQFLTADNRKITVLQYFREKGYQIRYPKMPCLHVGSTARSIYLPLELCEMMPGQVTQKKTGTNQVRELIRYAATDTFSRKSRILDCFNYFNHRNDPVIRAFGIDLGSEFLDVDARIINPPKLEYGNSFLIDPRKGSWRAENCKYLQPSNLIKWAVFSTDRGISDFDIRNLAKMVIECGPRLNMQIDSNYAIVKETDTRRFDENFTKFKNQQIQLVFVIIPSFVDNYATVKQGAEIRCGVLTQCIKSDTVKRRLNLSTINNILLKVNAKLNGINHKINDQTKTIIMNENVMFLGADVTHPSPDQRAIPSVVGVAASHDINGFQYNMRWRLQDPKKEIIEDMENILKEQLEFYRRKCGKYPIKIMYYRDGVSEGQFEQVRRTELTAMDRAIQNIKPKPKITCIVVQKRHHTRFFPKKGSNIGANDKFHNVPPGTIVDTKITHPNESQFFLVSHESIQGTAKPTKYCIIRDDANINIDDLQAITYNLCHMFSRCNRSVSYPAPAYNAHLAAYRGRVYIEQYNPLNMRNLQSEYARRQIKDDILNNSPMFFV